MAFLAGSYFGLTLYAQNLEGKKELALSELHELRIRAKNLQILADEIISLQQKAILEEELASSSRPILEWLQVIGETASTNRISASKISFDHKGSFTVEGESPEMQQIAFFNDQLCNLDFLTHSQVKTIIMNGENSFHFIIGGTVIEVKEGSSDD